MTPPINIDGDTVEAITIDGTSVSEVTVDGSTVFDPISGTLIDNFEDNLNNWGTVSDASLQSGTVQKGSNALGVDDGGSSPRGVASQPGDGLPAYPTRGGTYEWFFQLDEDAFYQFGCFVQSGGLGRQEGYYFDFFPSNFVSSSGEFQFKHDTGSNTTTFDSDLFNLSANTGTWFKMVVDAGFTTTNVFTAEVQNLSNQNVVASVSADPTATADLTGGGWLWQTRGGSDGDFYCDQFIDTT